MEIKKELGSRITSALALRGKKQKELANAIGVTDNTISYYCSGSRSPNIGQLVKIAQFLNVTTDYLLGCTDDPNVAPTAVGELGLSPNSVGWIKEKSSDLSNGDDFRKYFSLLLESYNFQYLIDSLIEYCISVKAEKIASDIRYSIFTDPVHPILESDTLSIKKQQYLDNLLLATESDKYSKETKRLLKAISEIDAAFGLVPNFATAFQGPDGFSFTELLENRISRDVIFALDEIKSVISEQSEE